MLIRNATMVEVIIKIRLIRVVNALFLLYCVLVFCSCSQASTADTNAADKGSSRMQGTWTAEINTPIVENTTGKTIIQHTSSDKEWSSDINIISSTGTVIYCDAFKTPEDVIDKLKPDILCVTHMHHIEHVDQALIDKYKNDEDCYLSLETAEAFTVNDVTVTGIESSHGILNNLDFADNKNVVYIFEVDGLKIAHLGGMNQSALSQEQLDALSNLDIMFVPLSMYGTMKIDNVYNMCEILKPSIIIPTHCDNTSYLEVLSTMVDSSETIENVLMISKDDLKDGKRRLITLSNTLYDTE